MTRRMDTEVLVVGGGLTGAGVLRDLALRGVPGLMVERKDIDAGASGANHGLLHSGARYVVRDPESAAECVEENRILKRVASGCVEDTGGVFLGLDEADEAYGETFLAAAARVGLEATPLDLDELLEQEPLLNPQARLAIGVPDASINPFLATLANLADAEARGARVLLHTELTALKMGPSGRIERVECVDKLSGETIEITPRQVVSAAGPWVDRIAAMAGSEIPIAYSKGSLLISNSRLVSRVINRLRPPADGDIVVPGESVTITGTNSVRVRSLDHLTTTADEVDALLGEASQMVPALAEARIIRAYAGVRPLVGGGKNGTDRQLSRTFTVFDHEADGVHNLATITGGKLTTYRLMAQAVSDLVCRRLGVTEPCRTHQEPLPGSEAGQTLSAAHRLERLRQPAPGGAVLCECELVSRAQVLELVKVLQKRGVPVNLNALRLRSRLGMGSCQGGFCGFRTVAALYQSALVRGGEGTELLVNFLERRWSGIKPVLWGEQLRQEQLLEAIYCGTLNIDGNL